MKEELDFIGTIVRLMRLTRESKLGWSSGQLMHELIPTYFAKIKNLEFILEHVGPVGSGPFVDPRYRLVISDTEKNSRIVSLPLPAANDLAAIVRGYDEEKLEEINRRLDAELG